MKTISNKGWFFVLPVVVVVAFSAVIPLMTVVNYAFNDSFGQNEFFWVGFEWFEDVLGDERLQASFWRQLSFSAIILAIEMCFAHYLFLKIGLIETHAIFASCPLIVAALSVFFLGEKVGWRRWSAILVGFLGILIMLRPGSKVFDPLSLIALGCAFAFAIYQILTRYVSSEDSPDTSLFYTGITGFVILGSIGPFFYTSIENLHWLWLLVVCMLGAGGHFLMINAFKHSEASLLQPFTYLQLVFVSIIGVLIFKEKLETEILIGAFIVIVAGLFTFWREYSKNQQI